MLFALILLPVFAGLLAFLLPGRPGGAGNRVRPLLLPLTGAAHLGLTILLLLLPDAGGRWIGLDPLSRLILPAVSVVYFFCSLYAMAYLRLRSDTGNRVFCACLLLLPGLMSFVLLAQHLGVLWIAVEATTLTSAPLIYYFGTPNAIEATWKYLLIGSVGVALALLGTFFLAYAAMAPGAETSLHLPDLVRNAPHFSKPWLYAAFALLLIGYGTKMGLAPMHTWKPDAYGEAPGVVGALLGGALTCCGFLALLRIYHIALAAGEGARVAPLLVGAGLFSMAVAAVFLIGQRDFKRLLAYSSVEHMGILLVGLGLGGAGVFGSLLHLLNNALVKGSLFLSAGCIHRAYQSKSLDQVQGVLRRLPWAGALFLAGFLAITGTPPFGTFLSEFTILNAAFDGGHYVSAALFLLLLLAVFMGMGAAVLVVVQGRVPPTARATPYRESLFTYAPPLLMLLLVLVLGVYIPDPVQKLLEDAVRFLEVKP